MPITALALNCTLKADAKERSSTDAMIAVLEKAFEAKGVAISETIRVAALDIKPGVTSDEGDRDRKHGGRQCRASRRLAQIEPLSWRGGVTGSPRNSCQREV